MWREGLPLLGVVVSFSVATLALYAVASSLSHELKDSSAALSFPTSVEELQLLAGHLRAVKDDHFYHVLALFAAAYIYKQTFAIPGSVFMNVLAGALFGVRWGLPLVCLLTAVGASCCYLLSLSFGRALVLRYCAHRLAPLREKVGSDGGSLLVVLISLRLFPMSPNWLLNLLSPLLGVPLHLFFISVLIGLVPYNFVCVQAGLVLSELQLISVMDTRTILGLLVAAATLLATGYAFRRFRSRQKQN